MDGSIEKFSFGLILVTWLFSLATEAGWFYPIDIKVKHNTKIPWGQLYAEISEDSPQVLQFAWKDASVVFFMATVHDGKALSLENEGVHITLLL